VITESKQNNHQVIGFVVYDPGDNGLLPEGIIPTLREAEAIAREYIDVNQPHLKRLEVARVVRESSLTLLSEAV